MLFRSGYAVFSESMRTTLAMRDGARGVGHTMTTQQHSAMANSHLYMHFNMARTLAGNREAVEKFRQATMMRVLGDPVLKSYSDLLLGYMTGINEVITQANVLDLGVRFHEDEVELAAFASFIDGGSIRAAMRQAGAGEPALTANLPDDVHMVSAFSVALRPEMVRSAGMGVLDFILQNSPNARRKLRGETRERLMKSAEELFGQMTGQMASMTALPKVETQAAEATLTIFQIRDKMAFVTARDDFFRMVGVAGEELAAPIAFRYATDQEKYRDVMIDYLRPQFNYPDTRYEELFRLRMQSHYGLDGYVYRMAIVKNLVMVSVGSDVTLLRAAIDKALDVAEPTVATSIAAARDGVPAGASVTYFGSLPAMLSRSIIQAGEASGASMGLAFTEEDKAIIRSQGLMGFGISLVDGNMVATSRMSYEQIAGAVKLADRHLPPMVPPVEPTPEPRRVEPTPEPSTEPVPEPVPQPTPEPTAEPAPLPDVTPEAAPEPTPEPTLEVDRGWMVP